MQRLLSLLAVGALATTAMAQFTLVTPNGYASTVGNTNNSFPWNRATASMRIQFIIDSSHFTAQGVVSPIIISKLRYRPYPGAVVSWAGGSWPSVRIDMATTPQDWSLASTTFANNLGPDLTTVLNGPVTVQGGSTLGVGVVVPWHIDIPLTTNFLYDPTTGNDLTVDIYLNGTGWTGVSRSADHVSTVGQALGCRVYDTTGITGTIGTITTSYAAVTEFTYVPANGLFAGFTSNVTGGPSPLAVNFTSQSFSSDPGGITNYAWDFDGDSVIDSTAPNPSFVYNTCGNYNVSLTVTDASHPPSTLTRNAYIRTDQITANFSSQVIGPLTVQFTDTSNMAATSWDWDLDGDSITDSTLQNPAWVYPNANPVNVTLKVTRLCSPISTITKSVVPTQQLTTNLAVNNGVGTPATLYFNLNVLNPLGVNISSFDTITQTISTPFTADVYLKMGTYQGSELNPAPWTLVGTASGTTPAVANTPANSSFPIPLHIPFGSYGVAIRYVGAYPRYVTQTALTTWSNGDLSLTAGAASLSTAGAFTGTNLNSPRSWAGTLYYGTNNVTSLAGYGWFGPGCPGTVGQSHLVATTLPQLGGTLSLNVNNMQFGIGLMIIGLSNTISGFGPLPVDLTGLGMPGCPLRVSLDATDAVVGVGTSATWNFPIPNSAPLIGFQLYTQCANFDTINPFGMVVSDAFGGIVGN
jgi:PKD repeat protein